VDYLLFPSILCSWWARCPLQWPHTVTHTCPWFFEHMVGNPLILLWSVTWHGRWVLVYALSHLFWCGGWSLHAADSLFN
jgi:hypothetical protein